MKKYRIRKWSPIWWIGNTIKWSAIFGIMLLVILTVMVVMIDWYAAKFGLPILSSELFHK